MDYYKILGVSKDASQDEIKKAYRIRAKETHPDVNDSSEAEEEFKKVSEAYSVLGNPDKRVEYDNPSQNFGGFGINIDDFLNSNFGPFGGAGFRRKKDNGPIKGASLRVKKEISVYESIFGVEVVDGVASFRAMCSKCFGEGGTDFSDVCKACGGSGVVVLNKGMMLIKQTCRECSGAGKRPKNICNECSGSGVREYSSNFSYTIPNNFLGGKILVEGAGAPGIRGGPPGDIIVEVGVKPPKINIEGISERDKEILKKHLD